MFIHGFLALSSRLFEWLVEEIHYQHLDPCDEHELNIANIRGI